MKLTDLQMGLRLVQDHLCGAEGLMTILKKYCKKDTNSHNARYATLIASRNATSGRKNSDYKEEVTCEIVQRVQVGMIVKKGDAICTYSKDT